MVNSFNYTIVITDLTQKLVILLILAINMVLILLTITFAVKREYSWQKLYLFLYMWGELLELHSNPNFPSQSSSLSSLDLNLQVTISPSLYILLLTVPSECIWIHYFLPKLVQKDVEEAARVLYRAVDFAFSNLALDNITVDVPSYFFLSTQVLPFLSLFLSPFSLPSSLTLPLLFRWPKNIKICSNPALSARTRPTWA
jgi:hypothetical protein